MLRTMQSEYDRLLLEQEVRRLQAQGYRFGDGPEENKLGADAWILGVSLVEENGKTKQSKRKRGE